MQYFLSEKLKGTFSHSRCQKKKKGHSAKQSPISPKSPTIHNSGHAFNLNIRCPRSTAESSDRPGFSLLQHAKPTLLHRSHSNNVQLQRLNSVLHRRGRLLWRWLMLRRRPAVPRLRIRVSLLYEQLRLPQRISLVGELQEIFLNPNNQKNAALSLFFWSRRFPLS